MQVVGLIAGNGQLPGLFADHLKQRGITVVAVAHLGESETTLSGKVAEILWIRVGQIGKLISFFKAAGVVNVVMAGGIRKTRLFEMRPDVRCLSLLARVKEKKDDALLRAFAREMEGEGLQVRSAADYMETLLAQEGEWTRPLTRKERAEVRWGWPLAKQIGGLDVGQCIVVRDGVVLAVEAIEGTDAAIRRGGALGRTRSIVIKVCKPHQDLRFDLPTIGPGTIVAMKEARASVLAVEAGKTLLLEKERLLDEARCAGIAVVGISEGMNDVER